MMVTVQQRAARGARILDRVQPGWASKIARSRLAMETCDRCILGQLYDGYESGWWWVVRNLPARAKRYVASSYGFTLPPAQQTIHTPADKVVALARFKELADAWRHEINARCAPKKAPAKKRAKAVAPLSLPVPV
jgi:hypothetical protein